MIKIRTVALLTRQLNLQRLTNLALAEFGEGLFKKKKKDTERLIASRDKELGQKREPLVEAKMVDWGE